MQNTNPTNDMANVRARSQGFFKAKMDSTASGAKVKRGMRIEEINKEELLELEATGELTEIDYDEPPSRTFDSQIKRHEYELLGKEFNDGLAFYT